MIIFKFLDGVSADTTGSAWNIDTEMYASITVQVSIGTVASVNIQGRIPGISEWITMNGEAIIADEVFDIKSMPEMRAVSTGVSGPLYVYGVGSVNRSFS